MSKNESQLKTVLATLAVAIVAGGTAPWWVKFCEKSQEHRDQERRDVVPPKSSPESSSQTPTNQSTLVEYAVLPDLLTTRVVIWDAVPKLRDAGFLPIVDLRYVGTSRATVAEVIGVFDRDMKPLRAGQRFPANTQVRIQVQSDPSWHLHADVYSGPSEVDGLVSAMRAKETEIEKTNNTISQRLKEGR